ncbi:hypothetical protein [Cyclobacterium jeungdonense]|uniref:Uncharacterized protein n=1 Tax=Cyclobacterium jeungdonense TaxID=708087 RepID=A0ABT8C372_9BACT|nr:hypothetical protein [Cyclobacterium jeungdonense]MDN3686527.1 hypothetical protein [Cyclobacterium jeungdonense]
MLQHPNGANKGAGASRNLGIKNANTPTLGFWMQMIISFRTGVAFRRKKFLENPAIDVVYEPVGTQFLNEKAKVDYCKFKQIPIDQAENDISYPKVPYFMETIWKHRLSGSKINPIELPNEITIVCFCI